MVIPNYKFKHPGYIRDFIMLGWFKKSQNFNPKTILFRLICG